MNIASVLLASAGVITGGVTLNPMVLGILTTAGILLKSYHEIKGRYTRGVLLPEHACFRGALREQSSSVCTNDFMGILHPREQNFHPAKCSTIFNRLNTWEKAHGANNAPSCVLTRAK